MTTFRFVSLSSLVFAGLIISLSFKLEEAACQAGSPKNSEVHSSERPLFPFHHTIPHPLPHLGLHLKKGYHYTWVEQTISPKESPKIWNQSKSKSLTDVSNERYVWKNAVRASGKEWGSKALDKKAPL